MQLLEAAGAELSPAPCPGPLEGFRSNPGKCRSCGKCAAIIHLLQPGPEAGDTLDTRRTAMPTPATMQ